MIEFSGQVSKMEITDRGDQSVVLKCNSNGTLVYGTIVLYFNGQAPLQLSELVTVKIEKKEN